jgi:hypothetical protein
VEIALNLKKLILEGAQDVEEKKKMLFKIFFCLSFLIDINFIEGLLILKSNG